MYKLKVLSVLDQGYADRPQTAVETGILHALGYDYSQFVDSDWKDLSSKQQGFEKLVAELPDDITHVMLLDASDVIVLGTPDEVMQRWYTLGHPWVYNAEHNPWPNDMEMPDHAPEGSYYRYLNSGACIGEREHILRWYKEWNAPTEGNDQGWVVNRYLENYPDAIALDHGCELFITMCGTWPHMYEARSGRLHCFETDTDPLIVHFNGGADILSDVNRPLWEDLV